MLSKKQDKENLLVSKNCQVSKRMERKGPGTMTFTPESIIGVESSVEVVQATDENMEEVSSGSLSSQGASFVPETQN